MRRYVVVLLVVLCLVTLEAPASARTVKVEMTSTATEAARLYEEVTAVARKECRKSGVTKVKVTAHENIEGRSNYTFRCSLLRGRGR